jgi:hypothetical protein
VDVIPFRFLTEDIAARVEPGDPASVAHRQTDRVEHRPSMKPIRDPVAQLVEAHAGEC